LVARRSCAKPRAMARVCRLAGRQLWESDGRTANMTHDLLVKDVAVPEQPLLIQKDVP